MQEELFHDGVLQGLPRCPAPYGRFGKYSNLDKTVTWGRSRGLGPTASAVRTSKGAWKPYFSARRKTIITRWLTSWGSKGGESLSWMRRWRAGKKRRGRERRVQGGVKRSGGGCRSEKEETPEVIGRTPRRVIDVTRETTRKDFFERIS